MSIESIEIRLQTANDLLLGKNDMSIDLILTDPPYNASNSAVVLFDNYQTINENWDKRFVPDFVPIAMRKLKRTGSMLIFCSHHLLGVYLQIVKPRQILHWVKKNVLPSIREYYGWNVEYILWITASGDYCFNRSQRFSYDNVFITNVNSWKQTKHPAEKPYELISALVRTHSDENDLVVDPFLGSGTTALACLRNNRRFLGCDISQEYIDLAKSRLVSDERRLL